MVVLLTTKTTGNKMNDIKSLIERLATEMVNETLRHRRKTGDENATVEDACLDWNEYLQKCIDAIWKNLDNKPYVILMTFQELHDRFIGDLEKAGFDPYLFKDKTPNMEDDFFINEKDCLAMGMSQAEFNARKKQS
jgi:hypothetical protein